MSQPLSAGSLGLRRMRRKTHMQRRAVIGRR